MKKTLIIFITFILVIISVGYLGIANYKERIYSLNSALQEANKQLEVSKKLLDDKEVEIVNLEELINQREASLVSLNRKVNSLEQLTEKDFSIIKGGLIPLNNWTYEVDIEEILGKPISEIIRELKGDGFTGSFIKELTYKEMELALFSGSGETYWVMEMNIHSEEFQTFRGVKIGDSLDKLKKTYPAAVIMGGGTDQNNGIYIMSSELNEIIFKVKDGRITNIHLLHNIP